MPEHRSIPLPAPDASFVPKDFEEVLFCLPSGCPLVGGQAVAWWAGRYAINVIEDGKQRPVTSRDIDFWGGREELIQLAAALKRTAIFPHEYEMTVWVGAVPLTVDGKSTLAEFLHTIPGLDTNDPDKACAEQEIELRGVRKRIQVLTPISLVLAKFHALRHFDQKERQDAFHLKVCLHTTVGFIEELLLAQATRLALWNINRLVECHRHKAAHRIEQQYGFNILDAVPLATIERESANPTLPAEDRAKLARFCANFRQLNRASGDTVSPRS